MRTHGLKLTLALCFGALLLAGCGGTSSKDAASSSTASMVPADTAAYVVIDSDLDSDQWAALKDLAAQVPGAESAVANAVSGALGKNDLTFDDDVAPALGPQVVVTVNPKGTTVALTQSDDPSALAKLVRANGGTAVTAEVDGWTAVAESKADISAYEQALARATLAGDDAYEKATSSLPSAALLTAFVRPSELQSSAASVAQATGVSQLSGLAAGTGSQLGATALAISAEDDGLKLVGSVTGAQTSAYEADLAKRIPADAVVALSFHGTDDLLDQIRKAFGSSGGVDGVEKATGVPIEKLAALLDGEGVLYVRPGTPLPEVTVAVRSRDAAAGRVTLDRLAARVAKLAGGRVSSDTSGGSPETKLQIGPVIVTIVRAGDSLVVTTGIGGVGNFLSSGDKLVDSASFSAAAKKVDLGSTTSGFLYVDVDGLEPMVEGLAGLAGQPLTQSVRETIAAFDYVIVNAASDGTTTRFAGFVGTQ